MKIWILVITTVIHNHPGERIQPDIYPSSNMLAGRILCSDHHCTPMIWNAYKNEEECKHLSALNNGKIDTIGDNIISTVVADCMQMNIEIGLKDVAKQYLGRGK
jgi:hypothetical protein